MYDLLRLSTNQHLRAALCLLAGALACFQVAAQSVVAPDAAFERFMWTTTGANSQSVTYGTGGVPVASPTGSGTISADGTKSLAYDRAATWRNPSANTVAGGISGKIPINAKTAKILTAGMKVLPWVATGAAIWDLTKELGFDVQKENEQLSVTKTPLNYTWFIQNAAPSSRWVSGWASASSLCTAFWIDNNPLRQPYISGCTGTGNGSTCGCVAGPGSSNDITVERRAVTPGAGVASSIQELEDKIASESGWPSTSNLPQAVVDAAKATGQTLPIESPKVTGPATSPGTTKTEVNPTANTTKTTSTTHNHTYNDNRVTNTITTSVNVTNNTTGQGETTTTTEEPVEEPAECEKNPNALNCADLDTPEGDIPTSEKTITYEAAQLGFSGGACPADKYMTAHGMTQQIKLVDWASNCNMITTYVKPIMLAAATFMAFMIIFAGGRPE